MTTLKHRNNVRLVNGGNNKNGSRFDCVTCKISLSQYSVDQHLKTKMHLDNVERKNLRICKTTSLSSLTDKDKDKDHNKNITERYCNICSTRYNNKNEQK